MNNPIVSIIVPVYNAEKTLERTIKSVKNQVFSDWECILVDDGSTDGSAKICDEYVAQDTRFVCIHKENGGASAARNCGIECSRGKWVTFLDSDDELSCDFLKCLLEYDEGNVKLIIGGCTLIHENGSNVIGPKRTEYVRMDKNLIHHWNDPLNFFYYFACSKIYDRDMLIKHNIRFFTEIYYSEDFTFNCDYLKNLDGFQNVANNGYIYYQDPYRGYKYKMPFEQFKKHYETQIGRVEKIEEKCGTKFVEIKNFEKTRQFRNFWTYLITLEDKGEFVNQLKDFRNYKGWRSIVRQAEGGMLKKVLLNIAPAGLIYFLLKK